MFTQRCFIIKNTPELRDKIYRMGGRKGTCMDDVADVIACDHNTFRCFDLDLGAEYMLTRKGYIHCRENEELFLAIAALRDDSDIHQWFTDGEKWVISDVHSLLGMKEYFDKIGFNYSATHKATIEELIKHFDNENN